MTWDFIRANKCGKKKCSQARITDSVCRKSFKGLSVKMSDVQAFDLQQISDSVSRWSSRSRSWWGQRLRGKWGWEQVGLGASETFARTIGELQLPKHLQLQSLN